MHLLQQLGERVRRRRMELGLNQAEFAKQAGIPVPRLSSIEHGHQSIYVERAVQLAQALGVSTDYLLGLSDDPGNTSARPTQAAPAPQSTTRPRRRTTASVG